MKIVMKFSVLICFLMMIVMFMGGVSAANWTVNPGNSIQGVLDNALDNDMITVNDNNGSAYTYTENVVINKRVVLQGKIGGNVTVQALNSSKNVFTVNGGGSGSVIQGFVIQGASSLDSYGIYLIGANNCFITGNTVTGNWRGIEVACSNNTLVSGNIVKNNLHDGIRLDFSNNTIVSGNNATKNGWNGILLAYSNNNTVSRNNATNNTQEGIYLGYANNNILTSNTATSNGNNGIYPYYSNNNTITGNNIANNLNNGIYLYYSSANVHLNRITGNNNHGLYNAGNGIIDATNNWWGTNNPLVSSSYGSDIYNAEGTVNYDPWLVLNVVAAPNTISSQNSVITADLTRNNKNEDTSPLGHVPNGIPINFTTSLGTITTTAYTSNGKANTSFSRGTATSGTATVTTTLDKQSVQANIDIDTTPPNVNASLAGGVYNTTKSVTLTANDNLDVNPCIYYTLDGSTPTTASTMYTGPINIVNTTTLKFMAKDNAGNQAVVQTRNYTISTIKNINTNNIYSSIQTAIDDPLTLNGHTIEVMSGFYTENVVVNKSITIKPVLSAKVTVQALNSSKPVFMVNGGGSGSVIQSFNIIGATNSSGIYLNSTKNCYISKNILIENWDGMGFFNSINNTIFNNTMMSNKKGLDVFNSSNNIIDGNTIINNSYDGINLYMSPSNKINKNIIKDNGDGVCLFESSQNEVCENQIKDNNISGKYNHNTGIDISGSKNIRVYKNVITGHKSYGINIYIYTSSNNTIEENTVNNNLGDGIYLREASNNTIKRNLITNNCNGINLDDFSRNNTVLENNITFNRGNGIDFGLASDNTTIKGNNITDNCNGVYIWSSSSTITGNNIINNKNNGIYTSTSSTIQFNRISGNGGYGLHSQSSGTINADNNWWGSNNPIVSSNKRSDIYKEGNGNIIYDSWLVIKGSASASQINDGSSVNITVDATYNNRGNSTLSKGCIPDGSPVKFFSLLGTVNDSYTLNGKAVSVLSADTEPGKTVVWLTLDNQSIPVNVTINPLKTFPVADVIITKTDNSTNHSANVGDTITIITTAYNSGPSNVTGLVIYDPLPAGFTINSISKGSYNSTNGLWTVGTLENGTSATLQLIGMFNSSFAQKTLNSTAIKKKQNEYDPTSPNAATASIYVKLADVDITWAVDNARPHIGENATFTFTATNSGPDNATNISINVPLIPGFTATPSLGTSYANGIWAITSLISGSSANLTITGTANYSMAGSDINITATKLNQTEFDPDSTDSVTATASVPLPHIDLSITSDAVTSFYPSYESLNVQMEIPINNPITWMSIVVHEADEPFVSVVNVIVNGEKKFSQYFFNYCLDIPYEMWSEIGVYPINDINIDLKYPYGHISKTETIYYQDGPDAGFETIQSFAIANTKVTDDMVQYWLNQGNATVNGTLLYPVGYKKAAYGTFMTALTTLWLNDKLADQMAPNTNITWARSTPTIVMTGVSNGMGYVHCLDPAMGMSVVGDANDMKFFRLISSMMLSEVEHVALGSARNSVSSTLSVITSGILEGKAYKVIFNEDNTAVFMLEEDQRFKIIIDLETGLVKEVIDTGNFQYKGAETTSTAYCYHGYLTDDVTNRTNSFIDAFGADGVESTAGGLLITGGLIAFGACPPLGIAMLGIGLLLTADASGLTKDPTNPYNWLDFGVSTGLALAGPEGVTLRQAIRPAFRQGIKLAVEKDGYKTIAHATLGSDSRTAIKTSWNNYVTSSSMSGMISMYRPENN